MSYPKVVFTPLEVTGISSENKEFVKSSIIVNNLSEEITVLVNNSKVLEDLLSYNKE